MKIYHIVQEAEQDLDDILFYIAKDNQKAADQWVDKLYAAMDRIAAYPEMGHLRIDLTGRKVRFWPVGRYLIVYEVTKPLQILRVLSSYRDIASLI